MSTIGNKLVPNSKPERNGRNYAFIDGRGLHVEDGQLREYLRDQHEVKKAYVFLEYTATLSEYYSELKSLGYDLVFKHSDIGVELVLQAMVDYRNYNQAVVVTGEEDTASLIKYLLEHEKLKHLIVPDKGSSASLLQKQPLPKELVALRDDVPALRADAKTELKIQV